MKLSFLLRASCTIPLVSCLPGSGNRYENSSIVNQTTCNGRTYTYNELAGYGFVASDFRDKTGDTVGGPSAVAFDASSWRKTRNGSYEGLIWVLPDRGW